MKVKLMLVVLCVVYLTGCTTTLSMDWIPQDKEWVESKKARTTKTN